jgi:hypothetical protein
MAAIDFWDENFDLDVNLAVRSLQNVFAVSAPQKHTNVKLNGCHPGTLEEFTKSKMAAKMAAISEYWP